MIQFTTSLERVQAMLSHSDEAVTHEPFPAPLHMSRDDYRVRPVPSAAVSLAEFAREQGWDVRTQYAQGHFPHATTGKPGPLKDAIALRFGNHPLTERRAYAVYTRTAYPAGPWTWSSVMIWGPDLPPYAGCGIAELKAFLETGPVSTKWEMSEWVARVRADTARAELLKRRREVVRAEVRKLVAEGRTPRAWPAALLDACRVPQFLAAVEDLYSAEELIKIINTKSRAAEKDSMR